MIRNIIIGVLLLCLNGFAADLSKKSTDELLKMRGTLTTKQERIELHAELLKREKTMTKEQKKIFYSRPEKAGSGKGPGTGPMPGRGQGPGRGNR